MSASSPGDPFSAGASAGEEAFGRALERVLAWLVPPQVHKLNNAIMQATAAADLVEAGAAADAASLRGSLAAMAERLAALARFARRGKGGPRSFGELAREVSSLVEPWAAERGVRFELLLCTEGGTSVEPPLAALVVLAAREIALTSRADVPSRDRVVRMRFAARGPAELAVWLSASPVRGRDESHETRVLAALNERLASSRARVGARSVGGARGWRMAVPADILATHPRPLPPARILLVDAGGERGDLVAEVLSEEFRVRRATPATARDALERSRFELVLVDAPCVAAEPPLLRSLRRKDPGTEKCPIAVLGETPGRAPEPGVAQHREPLSPDPLLRFVRTCLTRSPTR